MKKIFRRSIIMGMLVFLVIGIAPLYTIEKSTTIQKELEFHVQSQRTSDFSPIESTINPLMGIRDNSYFSEDELAEVDSSTFDENTYIEFDVSTGAQSILSKSSLGDIKNSDPNVFQPTEGISHQFSGHIGDILTAAAEDVDSLDSLSDNIRPSYIFGDDNRTIVSNTTAFPFSSVVKIYVEAPNGTHYIGSGAIIDETHVLTVGHIGFIHDAGGLVTSMEIVPGKSLSYEPYGSAYAEFIRMPTEWVAEARSTHDWALVTLDRPIGNLTGWMGIATYPSYSSVYKTTAYTAGFPGDKFSGERMYNTTDVGKRADADNHWFALDTYGGQSGSPIWTLNASGEYIITVLAYEYLNGADWNFGTRINRDVYSQIETWLAMDSDPVPKPDLRVVYSDLTVDPWTYVYKKQTYWGILTDVENIGIDIATNISVGFYLSEDSVISIEDYRIGTVDVDNIGVLESKAVDWYGTVSRDVPDGWYYIGWVIDPENTITEFDENNNAGKVSGQVYASETQLIKFLSTPLGLGVVIGGGAVVILLPTILISVNVKKRRKRKRLAEMATDYNPGNYQDPN